MNKFYFFITCICIVLSQNLIAQVPEIFGHRWELDRLIISNQEVFPPVNNEVESVELLFDESLNDNPDTPYSMTSNVCDSFFSSVVFGQEDTIEVLTMGFDYVETQVFCDVLENLNFQEIYFEFYIEFLGSPYEYQITFTDDDSLSLEVYSPNGDIAIYNSLALSVNEVTGFTFSIYPNPVQNQLHIQASDQGEVYNVTVFDIQGRVLVTTSNQKLDENPIQVQNWTSGVYFLRIENQNGNSTTKRFIKK